MTNDELQLLREFRAEVAEPDAETARRVYAYATQPRGFWHAGRVHSLRRQRSKAFVAITAVAALAGVMVATPALGFVRDALPFWNQPSAPPDVKVEFLSMNIGTPEGMSPQAVSDDTRQIEQVSLGGQTRTLWVAPAKSGGFCFIWLPAAGGGCSTSNQPLLAAGMLVPAHDSSEPAQTTGIPEGMHYAGVPEWITGDVTAPASDVVIRFSDGSTVHPQIVWVSAPIDAGFFAYDVPSNEQSSSDHVTEVDAYNTNGELVTKQTLGRS